MLDQVEQVKNGMYLPNYGYMIAKSATPEFSHKFFKSDLFKQYLEWYGGDFQDATGLMR